VHRPFVSLMDEETALSPTDDYAVTKASSESALREVANRHSVRCNVVRLAPTVGGPVRPGGAFKTDRRFEEFLKLARTGAEIKVTKNDGRQFIGARDAGILCSAILGSERVNETYLAAARNFTTWRSIAEDIVQATASESKIMVEDTGLAEVPFLFNVDKIANHFGLSFDSSSGLADHINHLVTR
jgi:nucleoside-diphosphate-sugar epimerase